MRRCLPLALACLLLPLAASGARKQPQRLLQATVAERGWVMAVDSRRARLRAADGARQSFRVKRGERWLGLSEFSNGWIAAGIRPVARAGASRVDLSLVADLGRGPRRLRQPPIDPGATRTRPIPIASHSGLEGLAWLEGDSLTRLDVRVATFEDGAFEDVITLSRAGSGTQTGLSAAVLEDGTWLLVWSRFDGRDDEIFWAARAPGDPWTAPRRLTANNAVPDVTPELLPHGDGALVAWSRLESEYEVVTARFANGVWTTPRSLGVPGTLVPAFRRVRQEDYLLVRNAWPAGWTAFHFDRSGQPADFAVVAEESGRRPVFRLGGGSGLTLEWPDRSASAPLNWEPLQ